MSLRVGLTGGLASGKTTVAEMFASRGAYVLYADKVGHELMEPGQPIYAEIIKSFGESIVNSDKSINRAALARLVFGSDRIEELNRIVHPQVAARLELWIEEMSEFDPRAVLIFEAALILEAGLGKHFDKLVVVTSNPQQKLERFLKRVPNVNVNDESDCAKILSEAKQRMAAQLSDQEKIAAADYVIDNSGETSETERQVSKVYKELQQLAVGKRLHSPA